MLISSFGSTTALIGFDGAATPSCVGECRFVAPLLASAPVEAVAATQSGTCIVARDTHLVLCSEPIFTPSGLFAGPHGIHPPE